MYVPTPYKRRIFLRRFPVQPFFESVFLKKNVPWHILAPSTHPRKAFIIVWKRSFLYDNKESCEAGFSACGGSRKRHSSIPLQCDPRGAFLSYGNEVSYTIIKNVPWHILAPRRGCFSNHLPLRRVRILAEHFYQLQPHAKARDAAVTSYHMETLFSYDKKRSARMRTRRKNVPKHIFLLQIIEIILRQGTANGLWVLRKQYGQIAV